MAHNDPKGRPPSKNRSMTKTRTFVAITLEPTISERADALIARMKPHAEKARWVEQENLHLTLLFLGDLDDREVADACRQADWAARANQPFHARLAGVRAIPDINRPKALWLGVTDGEEELQRLQSDMVDGLVDLMPRSENKPYVPHLTLARLGRGLQGTSEHLPEVLAGLSDYDAGDMQVTEATVYASELYRNGPEYHVLARCPLGMKKADEEGQ